MRFKYLAALFVCTLLGPGLFVPVPLSDLAMANPTDAKSSALALDKIFSEDGIAIRGADPVAYFTQGQPVRGSHDYAYEWKGATWLFASAQNRTQFAQNPDAYAPQYGGFCAYGVAQGALVEIDPESWAVVEGKLYLNYDATVQKLWLEDVPGYIAQADQNWPRL